MGDLGASPAEHIDQAPKQEEQLDTTWLVVLGILIWFMCGVVAVGIFWLVDLYTPLSLHLVDSNEGLTLSILGWCLSGAYGDSIEWPSQLALQRGHSQD